MKRNFIQHLSFSPFVLAIVSLWQIDAYSQDLPEGGSGVSSAAVEQGYFPTLAEESLLRGPYNSRSNGLGLSDEEGPDRRAQIATDVFPYQDQDPNFYQRNASLFRPIDHVFGLGTHFDAATYEFNSLDNTSLTLDARAGFLNRQFTPELAMVKAGPLYLDVLWLGTGIVWSDFNGAQNQQDQRGGKNTGDGTTGYVELGLRGLLRFTDTIYLSVIGNFIYLPFENELTLQFGSGRDAALLTRFNYSETFGAWDVLLYDEFQGMPGLNWYGQASRDGLDAAGRYSFGFQSSGRTNQFFNRDFVYFTNEVGFNATRLVFDNQWRFGFEISHRDFWRTFSFENHGKREHIGLWLGYEGSNIPFAPRISYDLLSFDGYKSLWHRFFLQLTGRLSENVMWQSHLGTAFTSGVVSRNATPLLWDVRLDHTLTVNTTHWLMFGENIYDNDTVNQSLLSRFISYGVDQRLGRRVHATAFVQFADSESSLNNVNIGQNNERLSAGLTMRYAPLDFTYFVATAMYERRGQKSPSNDSDRWLYRLEATQQLGMRLTASLYYQYEDYENASTPFTEHALGLSLRRYF
jgi:hypothetical protein